MPEKIELEIQVSAEQHGRRLDQVAAELFTDYSRSRLQAWIRSGALSVDGAAGRPRDKVEAGALLRIEAELEDQVDWQGEQHIDLNIVFEDADLIVLDKPAGLVVHPAAGHRAGTLVNALLNHCPELAALPRGGIVHRLDKETSGLMVVAKTLRAHSQLVEQLQARTVKREYAAVCIGAMTGGGTVTAPIGRHPRARKKMAVVTGGKTAITHYRLAERFANHTYITVRLETGRTHQIRVHMAHIHHPLVGDPQYGGRPRIPRNAAPELVEMLRRFPRQALHARRLGLIHPVSGEPCQWEVPLPDDMLALLECLRQFDPVAA